MHCRARGVRRDDAEVVSWSVWQQSRKTFRRKPTSAYATGKGVEQDLVRAFMWLKLAADSGNPRLLQQKAVLPIFWARGSRKRHGIAMGNAVQGEELRRV